MQRMTGLLRRCVEDYNMIEDGDKIAIGVSGRQGFPDAPHGSWRS